MWKPDLLGLAAVVVFGLAPSLSARDEMPATFTVRGQRLALNGEAVRSELLGMIELYRIGLYLSAPAADTAGLTRDRAKALRLQILHDTRSSRIPAEWRNELQPALTTAEQQTLRVAYTRLQAGDTLTISYVPGEGTHVAVNDDIVLRSEGADVMHAFLDQWLGQDPVSDDIKSALLGGGA